ncbi:MAG: PTS sugar transporter subunit IIA [Planctomycetota bacterium]
MKLVDFVCFEATVPQLQAGDRNGVITELVLSLGEAGKLEKKNTRKIIDAIIKRENEASTGIGKGIAVPHVKHPVVKDVIAAIGQTETGIDFSSLDKQLVYSVILLVSPADPTDKHLHAMEAVFAHLQSEKFLKFLRQSQTAEQIEDLIREADDNPSL